MKKVEVIDTIGLDEETISKIESIMFYEKDFYADDGVMFVELHNSKGDIIRIFPERIRIIEEGKDYLDGFKEAEENAKDLVELLIFGLNYVQAANSIEEAKNIAKSILIKSEKFRNV